MGGLLLFSQRLNNIETCTVSQILRTRRIALLILLYTVLCIIYTRVVNLLRPMLRFSSPRGAGLQSDQTIRVIVFNAVAVTRTKATRREFLFARASIGTAVSDTYSTEVNARHCYIDKSKQDQGTGTQLPDNTWSIIMIVRSGALSNTLQEARERLQFHKTLYFHCSFFALLYKNTVYIEENELNGILFLSNRKLVNPLLEFLAQQNLWETVRKKCHVS